MAVSPLIFIPERVALGELDRSPQGGGKFVRILKEWLSLIRELVRRVNEASMMNFVYYNPLTPFTALDFTSDSGTWDVEVTDIAEWSTARMGNLVFLSFEFEQTTVTGAPTELRVALPLGMVANRYMANPCWLSDNGTFTTGLATVRLNETMLRITRTDGTAFAAAVDSTFVYGQIWIEVK